MHPKHIKNFFDFIGESIRDISIEDFEMCKKQLIIANEIDDIDPWCIAHNNVTHCIALANRTSSYLFNKSVMNATSETDVKEFFAAKYKDCPLSIVVSGAVSSKILMKALQSSISKLSPRKTLTVLKNSNISEKKLSPRDNEEDHSQENRSSIEVTIRQRQMPTFLGYCYNIPANHNDDDTKFADVFFWIFHREAFLILMKTEMMKWLSKRKYQDNIETIYLIPKTRNSLLDVEKSYEYFIHTMCTKNFSREFLNEACEICKIDNLRLFCDLYKIGDRLLADYIYGRSVQNTYTLDSRVKNADPKRINSFAKRQLPQKHILKMKTRVVYH
jgi:hypothetical protein